ncbi:Uncharacterised protein [uncultured archaeon]|nr:Uncharacterised protein [uncultured archaeon]
MLFSKRSLVAALRLLSAFWGTRKKAVAPLLAGALYVGIVSVAVLIVVQVGNPALTKMQDVAAIDQARDSLSNFDKIIEEVAAEGKGSARVVPIQIKKGDLTIDSSHDKVEYALNTKAEVVSPRTKRVMGNLVFGSNTNAQVTDNGTDIVLENEHLAVIFNKTGNSTNYAPLNISTTIKSIYMKDTATTFGGVVRIRIDGLASNEIGNGYVYAEKTGMDLARGRAIIHVNNSAGDYDVYFTLESGRDHLIESVENFNSHI